MQTIVIYHYIPLVFSGNDAWISPRFVNGNMHIVSVCLLFFHYLGEPFIFYVVDNAYQFPEIAVGIQSRPLFALNLLMLMLLFGPQVAILVPFRNRHEHLPILLRHLIPALQRQRIQFGFYVIEQVSSFAPTPLCDPSQATPLTATPSSAAGLFSWWPRELPL